MADLFEDTRVTAILSPCRTYRYRLDRQWADGDRVAFIMLNPSTADEKTDDPTIRRCVDFAKQWGFGGLIVGNLFGLRSTDPKALYSARDPIGSGNDEHLLKIAGDAEQVICAWGTHGAFQSRGEKVSAMLSHKNLAALKVTKDGHPGHPLYVGGWTQPKAYFGRASKSSEERT